MARSQILLPSFDHMTNSWGFIQGSDVCPTLGSKLFWTPSLLCCFGGPVRSQWPLPGQVTVRRS